jgi:hypothetical protein
MLRPAVGRLWSSDVRAQLRPGVDGSEIGRIDQVTTGSRSMTALPSWAWV